MDIQKRNNVRSFGYGTKTILFAHGFACDQTMWRYVTPAFEFGYRVVLFDFVGAGRSDKASYSAEKYASLEGYVQDILDICTEEALKDVVLVGHSISGIACMLAALERLELFSNIVMISSSPCYLNKGSDYRGGYEKADVAAQLKAMEQEDGAWVLKLGTSALGNSDRPELLAELISQFSEIDASVARQFSEVAFYSDYRDKLKLLKTPTLILQSSEDNIVPGCVAQYMHDNIEGSRLEMLEATGHYPCLSAPDEVIEVIKNYLEADTVIDMTQEDVLY